MNKAYKVKLKREPVVGRRHVYGFEGHNGPKTWDEIVQLISEAGVGKVEFVQHLDKNPVNSERLKGGEMLQLWKAVVAIKPKG